MKVIPKRLHTVPGRLHKSRCPPLPRDIHQSSFIVQDAVMNCSTTYAWWLTRAQIQIVCEINVIRRATLTNRCAKNEEEMKPPPKRQMENKLSTRLWNLVVKSYSPNTALFFYYYFKHCLVERQAFFFKQQNHTFRYNLEEKQYWKLMTSMKYFQFSTKYSNPKYFCWNHLEETTVCNDRSCRAKMYHGRCSHAPTVRKGKANMLSHKNLFMFNLSSPQK